MTANPFYINENLVNNANKFMTYKAVGTEPYISDGVEKTKQVTAWFAPEINSPFGPLGYGNLPGLILELQVAGKTYIQEGLDRTKSKPEKIKEPTKGKVVSRKEFGEIGKRVHAQMDWD